MSHLILIHRLPDGHDLKYIRTADIISYRDQCCFLTHNMKWLTVRNMHKIISWSIELTILTKSNSILKVLSGMKHQPKGQ